MTANHALVLVCDTDRAASHAIARYLSRGGYEVQASDTPAQLLELHRQRPCRLAVIGVPKGRAADERVITLLRSGPNAPFIVTLRSAPDRDPQDEMMVDDYVVKPFSARELMARIDRVIRTGPQPEPPTATAQPVIQHGELSLDLAKRRATLADRALNLTQREFDLLAHLAGTPGVAHSRDELMHSVWGYDFYTDTSTVTVHMRRLRQKLEREPSAPQYLHTVWGHGYRFQVPRADQKDRED